MELVISTLTALGTVGACVISLFLAYGKYKHKLDCVFVWGTPNDYKPTLLVNNLCNRTIVIKKINILYAQKPVATFVINEEYSMRDYAVISANTEKRITFEADNFVFPDSNKHGINSKQTKKILEIAVYTTSGKKFVSKGKYSQEEIESLLFGYGLFDSD